MSHTMLYRCPGPHEIHGAHFDYIVVEDEKVSETLAQGWYLTTPEAKAAHEAPAAEHEDDAPPTRDEMLQKAGEIGLKVDKRWSDARLLSEIGEKLKG